MFFGLLGLHSVLASMGHPIPDLTDQILRVTVMTAVLWFIARPVIDLRVRHLGLTLGIGVLVLVVWIGPDLLSSNYRHFWLFENPITGKATTSFSNHEDLSWPVLALRMVRAAIIVPIVEELFWRAWLMRWLIDPDFNRVPLGKYSAMAFWVVALMFASEHGPYWDVGLLAGIIYNWWMVRTKSLGDLILAHGVTNFGLGVYVIVTGKWEYWL